MFNFKCQMSLMCMNQFEFIQSLWKRHQYCCLTWYSPFCILLEIQFKTQLYPLHSQCKHNYFWNKRFQHIFIFLNLAFIWITSWDSVTILICYWMRVSHWSKSNSLNLKWSPILNLFDTKILSRFICKKRKVVVWGLCRLLVPILSYPLDKWQQRRRKSPGGDKPDKVHENYD